MTDAFQGFDNRLKKISRNRDRMSQGYISRVGKDGLIVFRPQRRQGGFPIKGLAFLTIGFFCFKGLLLAHLGEQVYTTRVAQLGAGTVVEQAGALLMQSDPVSVGIAQKVRPLIQ